MKKEKILALMSLCLIIFSFLSVIVFAEEPASQNTNNIAETTKGVITGIIASLKDLLSPLFGDKEMLTRAFFAILLYMILYTIVGSIFKAKKLLSIGITVVITALALLALPSNFITAIRTGYGAMGGAILSIIPFIILLIFTVKMNSKLMARLLWIFFFAYYLALYLYQWGTTGWLSKESIPYFFAFAAGLIIIVFIGSIRKLLWKGELEAEEEAATRDISFRGLGRKLERKETTERLRGANQ
ncbi:MAG: hypothetical protein NT076_02310 [Candidatus Pacearchaeota archaeon]|nr:hypothetical protein [Candidatus Pacearchaeota archaeon]